MNRPDPHPPEILATLARRDPAPRIAVAGASNNPEKYGHIIVRNLAGKGYTVLPINPRETQIAGLPSYASLREVPGPIDILSVVTPPGVTLKLLDEAAAAGVPAVFLQEGTWNDEVIDRALALPFKTMYEACIMVVTR